MLDGEPLRAGGKGQRKPLALLKALIAFGGRNVSEARLADALWPDADGAAAYQAFTITLHRLRKLLGVPDALVVREGRLSLDPRRCWVDAWVFERLLGEGARGRSAQPRSDAVERALGLYRGPFLPEEVDEPWATHLRERLRSRYLRGVEVLGARLEDTGTWAEAAEHYRRALEVDSLSEELCRRLMICHEKLEQASTALAAFERCRRLLGGTLGVEPSSETRQLAERIRARG
ncbi:MAG: AfsR/SARP family transcriptional regulator [Deferrisomatales bacterium]